MFGYLIDMDGVIYRGHELIPGANRFIQNLRQNKIPFLFLTNNSQRTRLDVATRLQRLGVEVEEEHVFTCAMATARFLAEQKPLWTNTHTLAEMVPRAGEFDALFYVGGHGRTYLPSLLPFFFLSFRALYTYAILPWGLYMCMNTRGTKKKVRKKTKGDRV